MSPHILDWLAAYHDGELPGARLAQVEAHLRECPACSAELEALRALSAALQANPAMPARTPPERFVAQVRLRAQALSPAPASPRPGQLGWLLAPVGALGLWAFLQAVLILSQLVLIALPVLGGVPDPQPTWFVLRGSAQLFVLDLALTAVLAALLWGWLAGWWVIHSRQPAANR